MAVDCLKLFKQQDRDLINKRAQKHMEKGLDSKEAKILAIQEYQDDIINQLDDLFGQLGLEGFGLPEPATEEAPAPKKGTAEDQVVEKIKSLIGKETLSKTAIEKIGKEAGIDDQNKIKELSELAVVQLARQLAKNNDFEGLVKLYNDQPNLTHRTNKSIEKQQYSTPAPIAYLAGKYVGADVSKNNFEPSAGNGMLTIVGDPSTWTVNEIDQVRQDNLAKQGFKELLKNDGSQDFNRPKQYDAVITNPPFGGTNAIKIDGYKLNELAQIMSVRALDTMKDNGKAAIIIGGNTEFSENGMVKGRDRIYMNYLFNKYNVQDAIDISGDLYRKQGASFPIRLILINGRKKTAGGIAPEAGWFKEQAKTFDDIKARIDEFLNQQEDETIQPEELVGGPTDVVRGGGSGESIQTGNQGDSSISGGKVQEGSGGSIGGQANVEESSEVGSGDVGSAGAEIGSGIDSGSDIVERPVSGQDVGEGQSGGEQQQQPGGTEGVSESRPRVDRKIAEGAVEGESTVPYKPISKGKSFEVQTPAGMEQEVLDAQTDLENDVGDVDEFVREKLGYKSKEALYKALGAEQVDGVALAIRNIERGTGIIIGDQTGIGKGRQAAAIIRYGITQGLKPIFLTEKPNLFTDLYRDLDGIDFGHIKPFIVNSRGEKLKGIYRGKDVIHKAPSASNQDHKMMLKQGIVPNDTDVILATYSQFSNPKYTDKINFLKAMGRDNILILDESHNTSGQGNINATFKELLPESRGVVYLSGTYAKRADNMPVYALKTSMREANLDTESLISAIEQGGPALQEIVSSTLVETGELIRRERSFKGIEVNNHIIGGDDPAAAKTQKQKADNVTSIMNEIIRFQKDYMNDVVAAMNAEAQAQGEIVKIREGTNEAGVKSTPYFSKVFNVINQLLYSIKAKDTAELAIAELKAGRKPFIAVRYTMEAMLNDIIERGDIKVGDAISHDFRFVLQKGLEGILRISVKDAQGNSTKQEVPVSQLPLDAQLEYKRIMSLIKNSKTGLSISPLDEVIQIIENAGYKVGEVTGRKSYLELKGDKGILQSRKKEPVNELYRKYNNGDIDVLIVNSSGSTGASAHSDRSVKDQRQRHMLVLDKELNISTLVQIFGRINRTGQVNLPKYTFIGSHVPAEQRLMMMTMRKLKSLDANTTSNQKQSNTLIEVPEIFNKHGDQVVVEFLMENPEIIEMLGDPLQMMEANGEVHEPASDKMDGAANSVTGRVAILPTDRQAEFYSEITDRYNTHIQFLNDAGMNDLEVKQLPLRARTLKKSVSILGKGGKSKFGEDSFLEEVEADVLRKPMTRAEIDKTISDLSETSNEQYKVDLEKYRDEVAKKIAETEDDRLKKKIAKVQEDESLDEAARGASIKELTENSEVSKEFKIEKEDLNIKYVETLFNFFTPGRAVKVPFDFNEIESNLALSTGVFLGFDINAKKAKPFLRSNVILKFAVNDSRRLISIPASKTSIVNNIRQNTYSLSDQFQKSIDTEWDNLKKPKARGKRYIATGNILQALGNPDFRKGQIVKYTTDQGFVNTGVLLSESYDPTATETKKTISVPASKAAKFIIESDTGSTFTSSSGKIKINKRTSERFSIRVPKPKQTGGEFYLDDQINELVDNGTWNSVGQEMEAFTDSSRMDNLLSLLGNKFSTAFDMDSKTVEDLLVQFSERSASTYKDVNAALSSFIPVKIKGKVKQKPSNKNLIANMVKEGATEEELDAALDEQLKFSNEEAEKRFEEAGTPTAPRNYPTLFDDAKDFLTGFTSHFRYLSEKQFPREANILREFEGMKQFTTTQAALYVKGLVEPLTKQQYKILSRKIILSDMLESIEKGLDMTNAEGKLPFGFENKVELFKELKKVNKMASMDPVIEEAFDKRNDFINRFRDALVNEGLLNPQDIDSYYHRRVLNYEHNDFAKSVIFGRNIGQKKRNFQRMRTGTKGMDYSTNFIETEYKVVAEGLYELEKQKILKDLMAPFEGKLQALKKAFNKDFDKQMSEVEKQFGKDSPEYKVKKEAKRSLMKNYLMDNLPEGYVFWQPNLGNNLFWANTISQSVINNAMNNAKAIDLDGGSAIDLVDALVNDLSVNLAVGARRKNYMIPEQLAQQLEYMATPEQLTPMTELITRTTGEWKKLVLLSPNRFLRYNLNNLGGDFDRTLQVEPKILKYAKEASNELWDFIHTGKTTPQLLEAMRGSVIDSGYEIQELNSLTKQQWVGYFLDRKGGGTVQDFLKPTEIAEIMVKKPSNIYERYMEVARTYTGLRENVLRYSAYKLAVEKDSKGEQFYWASKPDRIDAISNKRQKLAKLSREVYGDYGNISYSGQQLRRITMPFYSWFEINMGTHLQLIKNASNPRIQKDLAKSALARGIPYATFKMAKAWASLFAFSAAVEAWNYFAFPNLPWVDDEEKDAAARLRRSNVRGMQVLLYVNEEGIPVGLPIIGAFYDFVDFFGIPDVLDEVATILTGNAGVQREAAAKKVGKTLLRAPFEKGFQMTTPGIKMPIEAITGQSYFPDPSNPIPIRDYGEWFFNALTLKDEYNYFFTDKPRRQSYLERKFTNSLVLREFDTDLLAYYQARHIIQDYTGRKPSASFPTNPTEKAKQQAIYYYTLAMRYGNEEEANKQLVIYMMNGGTPKALLARLRSADPFSQLSKTPRPGEPISEYLDLQAALNVENYQPLTRFVKQLTKDNLLVMKDAMRYYQQQLSGPKKKKESAPEPNPGLI